ncbi:ATP-binding protein, partial [Armatimonas sp.]|uniref:AAA family ATPase n=1 Tax=Armatimonas sp. TaxID=1872638 RepID=UPI00286CF702
PNGSGKSTILDAILLGASVDTNRSIEIVKNRRQGDHNQDRWVIRRNRQNKAKILVYTNHIDKITNNQKWFNRVDISTNKENGSLEFNFLHKNGPDLPEEVLEHLALEDRIPDESEYLPEDVMISYDCKIKQKPLYELYSEIAKIGGRDFINSLLGEIISNFNNIEILTENNEKGFMPVVNVVFTGTLGSVPVSLAGDGIHALVRMAMEIQLSQGLALIEEPEAHQHPATIRQIAKAIFASVRKENQVILTTHSLELIDALLDAATEPDDLDKLSVFMVKLDNGKLCSARIPGKNVEIERHQIGADLR